MEGDADVVEDRTTEVEDVVVLGEIGAVSRIICGNSMGDSKAVVKTTPIWSSLPKLVALTPASVTLQNALVAMLKPGTISEVGVLPVGLVGKFCATQAPQAVRDDFHLVIVSY